MSSDHISLASTGWQIISRAPESREAARRLLRWLIKTLGLPGAGIHYKNPRSAYSWDERAGSASFTEPLVKRPFPESESSWFFEKGTSIRAHASLLDLLAAQWTYLSTYQQPGSGRLILNPWRFSTIEPSWVAVSQASRGVLSRIPELSSSPSPLLITGESGSGRSHLALLIHRKGPTPFAPFSRNLFDTANHGTLYLNNWSRRTQGEQSAALKGNKRLIVAVETHSEYERRQALLDWREVSAGRGEVLDVPPLRERTEDIPLLVSALLDQFSAGGSGQSPDLTENALKILCLYRWPGNVRELEESLYRSFSGCRNNLIDAESLPPAIRSALYKKPVSSFPARVIALEYEALIDELSRQRGNMTQTAIALGLTPRQVSWRVKKYGINPRSYKKPHSE